jgi:hypothetical protein
MLSSISSRVRASSGFSWLSVQALPWQKPPFKRRREVLAPASGNRQDPRQIRADARARLIAALSRGRRWLDETLSGSVKSIAEIANREGCSPRKVNMTLSLAFVAPRSSRPRSMDGYPAASGLPAFVIFRHLGANSSDSLESQMETDPPETGSKVGHGAVATARQIRTVDSPHWTHCSPGIIRVSFRHNPACGSTRDAAAEAGFGPVGFNRQGPSRLKRRAAPLTSSMTAGYTKPRRDTHPGLGDGLRGVSGDGGVRLM